MSGARYVRGQAYENVDWPGYTVHVSDSPALAYGLGLLKTTNAGKTWSTVRIR